ncbi:MAG: dihydrofolate reductase family protein [Anaerolineae bacterium]|nr:dihydrofolate reductase family protein [Anaerolineae bacterium]
MTGNDHIIQFYPQPATEQSLKGTYLDHQLRQYSEALGRAYVYGNFVTSLDGRIAIPHPTKDGMMVPKATANDRDWRLFQELAAQADLIISSGRYLRDWADGRAQEILQVDNPEFADLKAWRVAQGLRPQPDIAIISGSLQFPIPDVLTASGRKVIVFTTANPDPARVREIEAEAGQVFVVGDTSVQGDQMVAKMAELGYTTVYSAAGPQIMHLLLAGGVLDRLYLTHASRLLAGQPFSSIVEGELFESAVDMKLNTVYFDPHGVAGLGQLFTSYDVAY